MHNFLKWHNFETYQDYLNSPMWAEIRERVWNRDNGTCVACDAPGHCVHHRSYKDRVLRGEWDSDLITLCDACHKYIEFESDGSKIPSSNPKRKEQLLAGLIMRNHSMTLTGLTKALRAVERSIRETDDKKTREENKEKMVRNQRRTLEHEIEKLQAELKNTNKILSETLKDLKAVRKKNVLLMKQLNAKEKRISTETPKAKANNEGVNGMHSRVRKLRGKDHIQVGKPVFYKPKKLLHTKTKH